MDIDQQSKLRAKSIGSILFLVDGRQVETCTSVVLQAGLVAGKLPSNIQNFPFVREWTLSNERKF